MMAARTEPEKFNPADHMRDLKGKKYLEVRFRVLWFREDHPDGYIVSELVYADYQTGHYVFKARVGWVTEAGTDIYAMGHGSETVKDFLDALEKAETKAIGRALAMLGYGTAQAVELDEGLEAGGMSAAADSPVERPAQKPTTAQARRAPLAVVPEPVDINELRRLVDLGLSKDAEAQTKLPKTSAEMNESELSRTLEWLVRRARAVSS